MEDCSFLAVLRAKSFLKYWAPVLIWLFVIFSASGDTQSFNRSSRIIGPLVRMLFPHMAEESVDRIVTFLRKGAHITEYAILSCLLWRAVRKPVKGDRRPWSWKLAAISVFLAFLYAASDELHQSFVPGRQGLMTDVVIDTCGAIVGILLVYAWHRWRARRIGGLQQEERPAPSVH